MTGIGTRVGRTEDHALLTGAARFVDDVRRHEHPDALHAVFVRSTVAHARIRRVDTTTAGAQPGVVAVLTAADLGLEPLRGHHMLPPVFDRPPMAMSHVRFVGEPIAVVVAETRSAAFDAVELVVVELDDLPACVDPRHGADTESGVLFPDHGTDVAFERTIGEPGGLRNAPGATCVRATLRNQRVASAPMEPDGALAVPTASGLTVWASTQRVHQVRDAIAASLRLDRDAVRVRAPNVGGGFGGKFEPSVETIVIAALVHRLRRPVAWVQSRTENLTCMPHGRGQHQQVEIAVTPEGELTGIWVDVVADAGAYPMVGALVPNATLSMIGGPYRWPNAGGRVRSVATNTTPVGAFRGAGRPEAAAAIERAVDLAARTTGIDPVDLRLRNLVGPDQFPYASPTGMTYDSGDYPRCLRAAVERVGYHEIRAEQQRMDARSTRRLGVGVAVWLDCTPMNRPGELASVHLTPGGPLGYVLEVRDGANDQGQSHQTTWALLLAERLGVPLDAVRLHHGDTAEVAHGEGTGSARSLQLAGNAVAQAVDQLLEAARHVAADLLEASPADIVLEAGRFSVRGAPARSVGWNDVAAAVPIDATVDFVQPGPTFPSGAHAAVVEVDLETGAVELLRFVAVDDCGTVVNPVAVEGQQHGGIVQGIGQALFEHVQHEHDGTPRTTTFADYLVPSAAEICAIDASTINIASPINPIGAKGIGQAGAIGSTAAVQNAVLDALAPLGVRHIDLPLTPERVWRAIAAAFETSSTPA